MDNNRKAISISKAKLIKGGNRGLQVEYQTIENRDGVYVTSSFKMTRNLPVQQEIKDLMNSFKEALLELCGFDSEQYKSKAEFGYILNRAEVTGITCDKESFVITGSLMIMKNKSVSLSTINVKEVDGFEKFDYVIDIVEELYKEVDLFMKGKKGLDKKALLKQHYYKKNAEAKEEDFESLSYEEKLEMFDEISKETGISIEYDEIGNKTIKVAEEKEEKKEKTAKKPTPKKEVETLAIKQNEELIPEEEEEEENDMEFTEVFSGEEEAELELIPQSTLDL